MIKRLFFAEALAAFLAGSAGAAQLPYPSVSSSIDTQLPTNQMGTISAAALRGVLHNITDSVPVIGALYPASNAGSSYTYQTLDQASSYTFTAATPAVTLQKPVVLATTASQIGRGWWAIINAGPSSSVVITPTGSTISANGATAASSQTLAAGTSAIVSTDGVNYFSTVISPTGGGGGGSGTVSPATMPASTALPNPIALYTGSPGSSSTTVGGLKTLPLGNGGSNCDSLEAHGGGITPAVTDNTTAFTATIAALGALGGCVVFGPGIYSFGSAQAVTWPASQYNISFRGTGPDSTELLWPTGGGFLLHFNSPLNSAHGSDFSMVTGSAGTSSAIKFTQSSGLGNFEHSSFSNITMRGAGSGYWSWGYDTGGVSGIDVYSSHVYGSGALGGGLICEGPGTGGIGGNGYSIMVNNVNPMFFGLNVGEEFGSYCQGAIINNINFTNGNVGVFSPSSASNTGGTEDQIIGGQISFNTGDGILIQSNLGSLAVSGVFVTALANHDAINTGPAQIGGINNNIIVCSSASSTNGIGINGSAFSVANNQIDGCGSGVTFFSSSQGNSSQSNLYVGNTINATNAGAASNHFGSCTGVTGTCSGAGASP